MLFSHNHAKWHTYDGRRHNNFITISTLFYTPISLSFLTSFSFSQWNATILPTYFPCGMVSKLPHPPSWLLLPSNSHSVQVTLKHVSQNEVCSCQWTPTQRVLSRALSPVVGITTTSPQFRYPEASFSEQRREKAETTSEQSQHHKAHTLGSRPCKPVPKVARQFGYFSITRTAC